MNNNVLGHGFFRKSKAYGLVCGIVLGLAFFGGQVSADEVTTVSDTSSATEQVANQTIVEPVSDDLISAVESAESVGVTVTQTDSQTVTNQEEAQADYASQTEAIKALADEQAKINAENEQIKAINEALSNAYDEAKTQADEVNSQVDEMVNDYGANVSEEVIDYGDGSSVEAYNSGKSKAESIAKSNNEAVESYIAKKQAVDAYNAEVKAREDKLKNDNLGSDEANKLYVTGEFNTNSTGLDFYKNIKVVTLDSDSKRADSLGWQENTTLSEVDGVTIQSHDTANDSMINGTSSNFLYKISDLTVGDSFKLSNVGKTTDGTNLNAIVSVKKASLLSDVEDSWLLIGKTVDNGIAVDYWNYDTISLSFKIVDDEGNPVKLTVASVIGDVDNTQGSKIEFEGNTLNYINPEGSRLIVNADKSLTSENFGVDGYQQAPTGTYLMVGSSDTIVYTHRTDDGNLNEDGRVYNYIEFDLFGTTSMVEMEEFKYLEDPILEVSKVSLPESPKFDGLKDNLTATYYLNEYQVALTTVKDVLNDQGISIDGGELKIGETGHYTLEGARILANGKDTLVKYDFEDNLDIVHDDYKGYRIYAFVPITLKDGTVIESGEDLKAYAQAVYDDVTGRFYVSLNSDFLAQVAKDSDFQAKVDIEFVRIASGDVDNVFTNVLAFEDEEGNVTEVTVLSNEVTTHTPEEVVLEEAPVLPAQEVAETPLVQQSVLPETGQKNTTILSVLGAGIVFLVTLFGLGKRPKTEE
ncbi:putative cross-wall-targeting lipoprotein signal [Streptococcus equinus]|nr:putative cross-wall-targeting lipoprotein signal [Streptococcus equinus]